MKIFFKVLKYTFLLIIIFVVGFCCFNWKNDISVEELKGKYANAESKFIEIDGMQVHYRDEGNPLDSLPLVLIHGGGSSLHTWELWVSTLKNEHRIITFDLPGYGLTGPNLQGEYSLDYCVNFTDSLLTKLCVKSCYLGGSSLGGAITWQYTLTHPERVKKMILIDADGYPIKSKSVPIAFKLAKIPLINSLLKYVLPRSVVENSLKSVYFHQDKVTPILIDRYIDLTLREGNRQALLDRMKQVPENNKHLKIGIIETPTLLIWGEKDAFIKLDIAQRFHKDLPNDTLIVFKNLGHTPMEEDPQITAVEVRNFLKR